MFFSVIFFLQLVHRGLFKITS